ncbi:hypothetical protein [Mesorhizobium sp. J428]|uniref:hypothetical protein n=1 Tax=Mesorhizobium sp. J428 TaxID=2898440 RepID=UPI002150EFB1|nr:hypothetical protein [Mesorhizobium sp. J428]MCR5859711.1 hypothetical protein [Mesorhizobium sp. J428]
MNRRKPNIHRFLEGHGIRCLPTRQATEPRPRNVIYGGRLVGRMIRRQGEQHTGRVIAAVIASNPSALYGDVLFAVSLFITAHRPDAQVADLRREFAAIDVLALRAAAQHLAHGRGGVIAARARALALLIASTLLTKEAA